MAQRISCRELNHLIHNLPPDQETVFVDLIQGDAEPQSFSRIRWLVTMKT